MTAISTFVVTRSGVLGAVGFTVVLVADTLSEVVAVSVVDTVQTVEDARSVTCGTGHVAAALIKGTTVILGVPFVLTFTEAAVVAEGVLFAFVAFLGLRAVAKVACCGAGLVELRAILDVVPASVAGTVGAVGGGVLHTFVTVGVSWAGTAVEAPWVTFATVVLTSASGPELVAFTCTSVRVTMGVVDTP